MKKLTVLFISLLTTALYGQNHVNITNASLVLDNGIIRRTILFNGVEKTVLTGELKLYGEEEDFLNTDLKSPDFMFRIDGETYSGANAWDFISCNAFEDESGGEGAVLSIRGTGKIEDVQLDVRYIIYPNLPVIRKNISFTNLGELNRNLEALDVEHLLVKFYPNSTVYHDYCRDIHYSTYVGDWNDPVLAVHSEDAKRGIIVGTEAPAVIKRTAFYTNRDDISAGLTHPGQEYPFRKWLKEGQKWVAPDAFVMLYNNSPNPSYALNFALKDYLRKHMGLKIYQTDNKPVFVYNTWNPFYHNVDQELITEVAQAAYECGIEEFVIDDGWSWNKYTDTTSRCNITQVGDYLIDRDKFPEGLKPVFDDCKSKNMKPGLWLSIGSANTTSEVYKNHPEWFVQDANGNTANLHSVWTKGLKTACMSTDWTKHIEKHILKLVDEHGLAYAKLDFAIATSAYVTDIKHSGCYAKDHAHEDHAESFIMNYESLFKLFDNLHEKAPDLFLDCTFETQGKFHLIDYAFLKHAEGNWLSNYQEDAPNGALRVRQLAYKRTSVIPAAACVIGNLPMDSKDLEFDFLSLIGTFPIMLGDPRLTADKDKAMLKEWSVWIKKMQDTYDYMSYRQDLQGFGMPQEGSWDGWQRINTDTKSGGIVGVFRQGAIESNRLVTVLGLDENATYQVLYTPDGKVVAELTGKELKEKGFSVSMERPYQGKLFEIRKK